MVKARVILGLVSATVLVPLGLPAQSAFGLDSTGISPSAPHPHYRVVPLLNPDQNAIGAQSATGRTIPLWSGSASYNGVNYPYQMVGKNPFVHNSYSGVLVGAPVIPVIIHFPDGTVSDPTKPTGCGTSTVLSPQELVTGSPIFVHHDYKDGNTLVGEGQYVSAFQRANFWNAIHSSGDLDYHVGVRPISSIPAVNISAAQVAPFGPITDPFGPPACGHLWAIDAIGLDNYVQKTLIPMLHVSTRYFPIFLSSNVVGYVVSPFLFTALGNHGAFMNSRGLLQTYAEVEYDTSGIFAGVSDVSVLAHEVGEWVDDPLGTNPTPASYPDVGCQHTLEVGDPLVGSNVTVGPMPNGITYHPQELAFFSWFYNQVPSQSVNPGWYSSNGTLTSDSAAHPLC
jgi:hypothetical protein